MKLLYFAWVRDMAGRANENVSLPDGVTTVGQLIDWQAGRDDKMAKAFANTAMIKVAVNQEYVPLGHAIADEDEIAFFPPVTGG
ncbi:MAG TPA: molybdopterin converting factor subunit 1 [Rhodospirillales bacterium]|nr:molybdopterin converting factor subunit 1 [Rhodospirillales bacterium]